MGETDAAVRFDLTDNCHLRPMEETDAQELHRLVEVNRAYLAEWMPWAADQTLEGTTAFLGKVRKQHEEGNGYQCALVLDGRIVGRFGEAGKLPKQFGIANSIDCRNENELLVGEMTNWRVQKVTLKP